VRDALSGEIMWEELEDNGMVTSLAVTRDRKLWSYVRTTLDERIPHDRVLVRSWPFDQSEPTLVTEAARISALALDDTGELLALRRWPSIEIWTLGRRPAGSAAPVHTLDWQAVSGTGEALDWHPQSTFLALSGADRATVFTAQLGAFWSVKSAYASDVRFTSDGALLAVGDWSNGAMYEWPPG
jgi:hypothetical protein